MKCTIKLKNGESSLLFESLYNKYGNEAKALEAYTMITSPSMIGTFSNYDKNNEPILTEDFEINFKNGVKFSKGHFSSEIIKTEGILKENRKNIERVQDEGENVYKERKGTFAKRVTTAIEQFVTPFNKEEWIQNTINRNPNRDADELREELEREYEFFQQKADLGTKFHKSLEIMFNNNFNNIDDIKIADDFGGNEIQYERIFDKELLDLIELEEINPYFLADSLFSLKRQISSNINSKSQNPKVLSEVVVYDEESGVAGTIDLLVIHDDGTVDIYDYKFSGKNIEDWNNYKFESIKYQQAFYKSMLNKLGIKVNKANIVSVPMYFNSENNAFTNLGAFNFSNITSQIRSQSLIGQKVNEIIKSKFEDEVKITESSSKILDLMNTLFNYNKNAVTGIEIDDKNIEEMFIKSRNKGFKNNIENIYISFNPNQKNAITDENEQKRLIKDYLISLEQRKQELPNVFVEYINNAKIEIENSRKKGIKYSIENALRKVDWGFGGLKKQEEIKNKINSIVADYLRPYVNEKGEEDYEWEIIQNEDLNSLGLVLFQSKVTKRVDVVNVNSENLFQKEVLNNKKTNTILGNFLDKYQEEKYNLLNNTKGNIENFKAFLYLLNSEIEYPVGNIISISENSNPVRTNSKTMLDNFLEIKKSNILNENELFNDLYSKVNNNNLRMSFLDGYKLEIKRKLNNINNINSEIKGGKPSNAKLFFEKMNTAANDVQEFEKELMNRIRYLESKRSSQISNKYSTKEVDEELFLANQALLELNKITVLDQYDLDPDGFFGLTESRKFTDPENFRHKSMVAITKLNNFAINNISQEYISYKDKIYKVTEELINSKMSKISSNLGGYTIVAYENLYEYEQNVNGDWVKTMRLRDPDNDTVIAPFQEGLSEIEKKYIRTYMEVQDYIRKKKLSDYQYKEFHKNPDRMRELQLSRASSLSRLKEGLKKPDSISNIKDSIKAAQTTISDHFSNLLNVDLAFKDDGEYYRKRKERKEMADSFVWLETNEDLRKAKLDENNTDDFEQDLELLLDLYAMNNFKVIEYNKVLPRMNAIKSVVSLSKDLFYTNLPTDEKSEIEKAIEKFIETKVYKIQDPTKDEAEMKQYQKVLTNITTQFRLALSPVTGSVSMLTNLFSSVTSSTAGLLDERLGIKYFLKGMALVGMNPKNIVSNDNLINEIALKYRVANAESFRLRQVTSLSNRGIKAFSSRFLHWMNSAPDYMHRVALFSGEMMKEGTLKVDSLGNITKNSAHQMVDGKMVYNEKLDDRFSELFKEDPDIDSIEYKEQLALYNSMKQELSEEPGGLNEDGSFSRAYTASQSHDKVKAANLIYGDYRSENRSEWEDTAIGALFAQFKRWMKAKKDILYKEKGTIGGTYRPYLYRGNEIITTEEYKKLSKDEKSNYLSDGWEIGNTWSGNIHEGIFQSLGFMVHEIKTKGFVDGSKSIANMDDFRKRNMKQMFSDIFLYLMIGLVIAELEDDEEKFLANILYKGSQDLNFLNLMGLNPFSPFPGTGLPFASAAFLEETIFDTVKNLGDSEALFNSLTDNISFVKQQRNFSE